MVIQIQKDRDCGIKLGFQMQEISRYKYAVYI